MNANVQNTQNTTKPTIQIETGFIEVDVQDTSGKNVGVWYFNPTDVGIVDRFNAGIPKLEAVLEPLIDANISNTGEGEDDESWAILQTATEGLYAVCDEVFRSNFAEAFFTATHPFSPVGGKFYVERAFEAAGNFISAQFDAEVNKVSRNIEKYTKQYNKVRAKYEKSQPKAKEE